MPGVENYWNGLFSCCKPSLIFIPYAGLRPGDEKPFLSANYYNSIQIPPTYIFATMSHPGRLEGKVAIVTGGGLGLGEGIVQKFVFEGAKVVILEINKANGQKVADSIGKDKAVAIQGDVTKLDDWHNAVKTAVDTFKGLDIVVNNAGVVHNAAPSYDVPESEYERIMNINVRPLYQSAKAVHPHFKKQGHGVFVNLSSISAPRPRPNLVWYAGSKGAVTAVTKGLAAEFAKDGIRCNAICPVAADTGMVRHSWE